MRQGPDKMADERFLAFDLGAESGRAVVGTLDGDRLRLEEILRFPNEPVEVSGTVYWDILNLHNHVLKGLGAYAQRYGDYVDGIGIDTWGVDFGLLDRNGALVQNPVHYRDRRTAGVVEEIHRCVPPDRLFAQTGMPLSSFSTLSQLRAMRLNRSPALEAAASFLMMPDLLSYFITGRKCCELTNAATTHLFNTDAGCWNREMFDAFDLPRAIMPETIAPGTAVGEVSEPVKRQTGLRRAPVIAPCTHDTSSALAAVPGQGSDWAFVSCGTWSVIGALTDRRHVSEEALTECLYNEMTFEGPFVARFNMGLWLLQQARAACQKNGRAYTYAQLEDMAGVARPGGALIDPGDECFLAPEDMLEAISAYCRRTGQGPPQSAGEVARCIFESLAFSYRHALDALSRVLRRKFRALHIVGGGSLNRFLCQSAADAAGIPVIAGPAEATVMGNILVQAFSRGALSSPAKVRAAARRSAECREYQPHQTGGCDDRYSRFRQLVGGGPVPR